MKLLVDLDIILYTGLFACKDEYYPGLRACDSIVENVLDWFNHPPYELVLSGGSNFRKLLCERYKANRKPESRPKYLYEAREYFKKYWGAVQALGEADDYIASSIDSDSIIISTDKDFKQLGVPIFNPRTWKLSEINNPHYYWWLQMMVGDSTDNVEGLKNPMKSHFTNPPCFTEATASKVLEDLSPGEMKQTVIDLYKQVHNDKWFEAFDRTARLLFLQRRDATEYYNYY